MNDHRSQGWDDAHALSGAYAVDALEADERERFEAHLAGCADCREEVASLREAAGLLGSTAPVQPPAALRSRVLAGIESVRPLPPETGPGLLVNPTPPSAPAPVDLASRRRPLLARLPLLVAAAAVLIAAVGGAVWFRSTSDDSDDRNDRRAQPTIAEQVLAAGDAVRVDKRFPDGAKATVVISRSVGRAVILTEDMPPAPTGKDYQLWLVTPAGEMQPAGLMPDSRDTTKLLEGDASRTTGVGITVEPDGGSAQPSGDPITVFNLEA